MKEVQVMTYSEENITFYKKSKKFSGVIHHTIPVKVRAKFTNEQDLLDYVSKKAREILWEK